MRYAHQRIVQLQPLPAKLEAVFVLQGDVPAGEDPYYSERVLALALVEEWASDVFNDHDTPPDADLEVRAVVWNGEYFDLVDTDHDRSFLGLYPSADLRLWASVQRLTERARARLVELREAERVRLARAPAEDGVIS